jgi:hypothetical protein
MTVELIIKRDKFRQWLVDNPDTLFNESGDEGNKEWACQCPLATYAQKEFKLEWCNLNLTNGAVLVTAHGPVHQEKWARIFVKRYDRSTKTSGNNIPASVALEILDDVITEQVFSP